MKLSRASICSFAFVFLLAALSRGADIPGKPLGKFLESDGQLRIPAGFNGSLDPAGYRMAFDATGAPRFVSTNSPAPARRKDLEGGASLEDGWDIRFSHSGVSPSDNNPVSVLAVASDGTNVYVGGRFFAVGQTLATNIAMWDGSHWRAMGYGLTPSYSGEVTAIAIQGTNVYAAGSFTVAGNQYANSIARWDGTAWSALGNGTQNGVRTSNGAAAGSVAALQVAGSELYVAGSFDTVGGVLAANVASWDGSQWHALGTGVSGTLTCLAAQGGTVYAGGVIAGNVQAWNGSQWSALNLSFYSSDSYVSWMGFMGTNLVCSMSAAEVSEDVLAIWNGPTWSPLPITTSDGGSIASTGNPGYASFYRPGPLASLGTNLFLAATVRTTNNALVTGWLEWNGTNWTMVDGGLTTGFLGYPEGSQLFASGTDGKHIYLTGDFDSLHDNQSASGIVAFDGSTLSALDEGTGQGIPLLALSSSSSFPQALAVDGGDLYAAIYSGPAGGVGCNGLGRWDGHSWHPVGDGLENGVTTTVAGEPYIYPGTVNAICVAGTNIYVGGTFTAAGTTYANNIAYWDGAAWHALGDGVNNGISWTASSFGGQGVNAIAVYGTNVFAGGFFNLAGGQPAVNIARWDGRQWRALAPGLDPLDVPGVQGFAAGPDGLYVIGGFLTGGGGAVTYNCIARWDGSALQPVGGGVAGYGQILNTIVASGTNIYVGGDLYAAGGVPVGGGVAVWNGSSWSGFPGQFLLGGTNTAPYPSTTCDVYGMAFDGDDLYICGLFAFNGTTSQEAQGVAKWTGSAWDIQSLSFDGPPASMVVLGRSLYVAGAFQTIGTNASPGASAGFATVGSKLSYGLARYSFVPYVSIASDVDPSTPTSSATIQFTRTGPTNSPLVVDFTSTSTFADGGGSLVAPEMVTIPAGSTSVSYGLGVFPGSVDTSTVVVDVEDGTTYTAGVPQSATVTLAASVALTAAWQNGPSLLLQSQVGALTPYLLQTTTNLAPPVYWTTVVTNTADLAGRWSFTDTNVAGTGARFYRLRTP